MDGETWNLVFMSVVCECRYMLVVFKCIVD